MSSFANREYSNSMTSEELRMTVAENIKSYRKMNNLTQMALAEKADLSVGYLHDLEAGTKWGMPETMVKLATALNVQPFQFFINDNEKPSTISSDLALLSITLRQDIDTKISDLLQKYR